MVSQDGIMVEGVKDYGEWGEWANLANIFGKHGYDGGKRVVIKELG